MSENKTITTDPSKAEIKSDEIEALKIFIEKKKIQNVALKKIMTKLNTGKNITPNK